MIPHSLHLAPQPTERKERGSEKQTNQHLLLSPPTILQTISIPREPLRKPCSLPSSYHETPSCTQFYPKPQLWRPIFLTSWLAEPNGRRQLLSLLIGERRIRYSFSGLSCPHVRHLRDLFEIRLRRTFIRSALACFNSSMLLHAEVPGQSDTSCLMSWKPNQYKLKPISQPQDKCMQSSTLRYVPRSRSENRI